MVEDRRPLDRRPLDRRPLVIIDEKGLIRDVSVMNQKGYHKSTEHGSLWHVHGETDRLLPYQDGIPFLELLDRERWFEAKVSADMGSVYTEVDSQGEATSETSETEQHEWGQILGGLIDIIRDRRNTRPDGSYTSYLFNAGLGKIKKKTGEEAIELLLAEEESEVAYEAADLIYHMLVLLEELGIPFAKLIDELAKRRGTGTQN